jgi:hypothetical protein
MTEVRLKRYIARDLLRHDLSTLEKTSDVPTG